MLYQELNDENLVLLTLAGEQRAYEVLVQRHEGMVFAVARSVVGNHFLAEDAVQDAFVTAWMKLNVLREPAKFAPWVCRIAKNCSLNLLSKYRSYLSLEDLENHDFEKEYRSNPVDAYLETEERELVQRSVDRLSDKVKEIIRLHYFEGLSVVEIAEKMQIQTGTVKSQLHDGRKKLRRELCAMNEEMNDTLVARVLKKVEELKNWQFSNSKNGFEIIYKDVLKEVEELPESEKKYHALADVLMRGWWWLPGEKNDALFARIAKAAECGRNDEVMRFIVRRQADKIYGADKISFIRDKQIPKLEKSGFRLALGSEWFWLGCAYFEGFTEWGDKQFADYDKGVEAFEQALRILPKSDIYHWFTKLVMAQQKRLVTEYLNQGKKEHSFQLFTHIDEFRVRQGQLCRYAIQGFGQGWLPMDRDIDFVLQNASFCDGYFVKEGLQVGEEVRGTDGTILRFLEEDAAVSTPAGEFLHCQVWMVKHGFKTFTTYFKEGVGIVKQYCRFDGCEEYRVLKSYQIKGGSGLIPVAEGNTWAYTGEMDSESMEHFSEIVISYADDSKVIFAQNALIERKKYDENFWLDMIQQMRHEYFDGEKLCDVTPAMKRATVLATTPMEKAHTEVACDVMRRILDTDPGFNPNYTASGHWNFFAKNRVERKEDKLCIFHNYRWSFEWKNLNGTPAQEALLYNDVYGNLQTAVDGIWCDKWKPGQVLTESFFLWNRHCIKTEIVCESEPMVTTKAGCFENCLKLTLQTEGFGHGLQYKNGKKQYYFAEGIGIVKVENSCYHDTMCVIYELTEYRGMGQGYMPMEDGLFRRYEGVNLTDFHVGWAEYTYVADEEGEIVIFSNQCGIRRKPEVITDYGAIQGEMQEKELWLQDDRAAARVRHGVNNFNLLLHLLERGSCYGKAERGLVWNQYRLKVLEGLDCGEGIPRAWIGAYARICLTTASALCGCGRKEEGYEYLEKTLSLLKQWKQFKQGEALEIGDPWMFGGIKLIKGMGILELEDGTREAFADRWMLEVNLDMLYYALTMTRGYYAWFDPVRGEMRFRELVVKARELAEE